MGEQNLIKPISAVQRKFTDLSFIDASNIVLPQHHRQTKAIEGYVIKVIALYFTSFDEVLVLDSDNTPASDPTQLFEDASYLATGNIFWPDFATNTGSFSFVCCQLHAYSS